MDTVPTPLTEAGTYSFITKSTTELLESDREAIEALYRTSFRDPSSEHLARSLGRSTAVAFAWTPTGVLAGFALGTTRRTDLHGLSQQLLQIAGLCCVDTDHRRRRLFATLSALCLEGRRQRGTHELVLTASRLTHAASYRPIINNPGLVPHPHKEPTAAQVGVAVAVADLLGEGEGFNPKTFACRREVTVGSPLLEIIGEGSNAEDALFGDIDPARGDALLVLWWNPRAPFWW